VLAGLLVLTFAPGSPAATAATPHRAPITAGARLHAPSGGSGISPKLALHKGSRVYRLPNSFLGVNALPYASAGSNVTDYLNTTGLRYVRWPGGELGDGFNYSTNVITRDSGSTYTAPWNTSQFITWCESIGCRAVFQLPGEINDSSTAAYYVAYIEHSLNFTPALWEIGNEPALWADYNIPWSLWGHATSIKVTPTIYAGLVQRYVAAIHAVDPKAHILGLPGVGMGAYRENAWIAASVALNGPNISGVGIHVYPAGRAPVTNGNLTEFYHGLGGAGGIYRRVTLDELAIQQACPTCKNLKIYATEVGSETQGSTGYTPTAVAAMEGFPEVPYAAAEIAQGMQVKVAGLDFYSLTSGYPGSLFTSPTGTGRPITDLFETILPNMDRYVIPTLLHTHPQGVYAVLARDRGSSSYTVFVANTNATSDVNLSLLGLGLPLLGYDALWRWTNSSTDPRLVNFSGVTPLSLWVPAESVALLKVASSLALVQQRIRLSF
jgi:hypothetical protein